MHLNLSCLNSDGHTELQFTDAGVLLEWNDTSLRERKKLRELISNLRENGGETHKVNADGSVGEVTKLVPGVVRNRSEQVIVTGTKAIEILSKLAEDLVEAEIKSGKFAMELQKDNSWALLPRGTFKVDTKATKEKPQKVTVQEKVAGG